MVYITYQEWDSKPIRAKLKYFVGLYITGHIEGTLPPYDVEESKLLLRDAQSYKLEDVVNLE